MEGRGYEKAERKKTKKDHQMRGFVVFSLKRLVRGRAGNQEREQDVVPVCPAKRWNILLNPFQGKGRPPITREKEEEAIGGWVERERATLRQ